MPLLLSFSEKKRIEQLSKWERELVQSGYQNIAGVDEAGRGPLAGPVVAAACILPEGYAIPNINDSKLLPPDERASICDRLLKDPLVHSSVSFVFEPVIDQINILQASLLAMQIAVANLRVFPDFLLVDGNHLPKVDIPKKALVKGDRASISIAAASIIAKTKRDEYMHQIAHQSFPEYGFDCHKGYATLKHKKALEKLGPCSLHRKSFEPVKSLFSNTAAKSI